MSIAVMKQALEFIAGLGRNHWGNRRAVMDALRAAIEQAEKRQWVGLTTQEILEIVDDHTEIRGSLPMLYRDQAVDLARDIEAKLKERNAY
jgi:hypothetical protein